MTASCNRCGQPLCALSSVAADPHDEPVYYCPCWPTDWLDVLLPVVVLAALASLFALLAWGLS